MENNREKTLQGRIAVVTGGAKGIGRAISLTLAEAGAYVIVNCNSSTQQAEETAAEILAAGGKAEVYACDVTDFEKVKEWFADIKSRLGHIDILVNNAGITKDTLMLGMKEEDFMQVVETNLKSVFNCSKWALKTMLRQKSGRIISISSVSGLMGNAGQVNYSASKAGIIGMTKSMAKEAASRGITVNAVAPGFIDTDMTKNLPEAVKDKAVDSIPLGHFGNPQDIAEAVLFLAEEKSSYITGQVLAVDGGLAM